MNKHLIIFAIISCSTSALSAQTDQAITPKPAASEQTISVRQASGLVISGITTICKGGTSTLKVEGEYESFLWNNGTTDRFLHIKEAGVYEVTVRTKGGCSITGSVNVEVISCL